jgi:uncharacterized RDD family membrane protein YckC
VTPAWLDEGDAELASMRARVGARLVDIGVVLVPYLALVALLARVDESAGDGLPIWVFGLALLVGGLYEVPLVWRRGWTVGKRVLGLRVARLDDGATPGLWPSTVRYGIPGLIVTVPSPVVASLAVLVVLSAGWNPRRQGFHDRMAGTVVVRASRELA